MGTCACVESCTSQPLCRMVSVHCMWPAEKAIVRWWTFYLREVQTPIWLARYEECCGNYHMLVQFPTSDQVGLHMHRMAVRYLYLQSVCG